tara:strand:- start:543 stop:962 length:420 start_codon:yes stop_codon:yes gene_type:complete
MARQVFRPYVKIIAHASNTAAVDIPLLDTSGNALQSNYISVEASGGSDGNYFVVHASGIPGLTDPAGEEGPTVLSYVSGTCGGAAPTLGGFVEFVLNDYERLSSISISQNLAESITYFISYGQVHLGSPLADAQRDRGK